MPDLPHEALSATVDSRGRITIPRAVRAELSLRPGDRVKFVPEDAGWRIEKDIEGSPFDRWEGILGRREQTPDEIVEDMRGR